MLELKLRPPKNLSSDWCGLTGSAGEEACGSFPGANGEAAALLRNASIAMSNVSLMLTGILTQGRSAL